MFGGQLSNGDASADLFILRSLKKGLTWSSGANLCTGKPPEARFDH